MSELTVTQQEVLEITKEVLERQKLTPMYLQTARESLADEILNKISKGFVFLRKEDIRTEIKKQSEKN